MGRSVPAVVCSRKPRRGRYGRGTRKGGRACSSSTSASSLRARLPASSSASRCHSPGRMLEVAPVVTLAAPATSHHPRLAAAAVTTNSVVRSEPRAFRAARGSAIGDSKRPRPVVCSARAFGSRPAPCRGKSESRAGCPSSAPPGARGLTRQRRPPGSRPKQARRTRTPCPQGNPPAWGHPSHPPRGQFGVQVSWAA
jgi:hypothetical protein